MLSCRDGKRFALARAKIKCGLQCHREALSITRIRQPAGFTVPNRFGCPAMIKGHNRAAHCLRFERNTAKRLWRD